MYYLLRFIHGRVAPTCTSEIVNGPAPIPDVPITRGGIAFVQRRTRALPIRRRGI